VKESLTEILLLGGIGMSLLAVWMQWDLHQRFSSIEESHKDGKISATKMARQLRMARLLPIGVTLIGATLLIAAAVRFVG